MHQRHAHGMPAVAGAPKCGVARTRQAPPVDGACGAIRGGKVQGPQEQLDVGRHLRSSRRWVCGVPNRCNRCSGARVQRVNVRTQEHHFNTCWQGTCVWVGKQPAGSGVSACGAAVKCARASLYGGPPVLWGDKRIAVYGAQGMPNLMAGDRSLVVCACLCSPS